MAVELFGPSVAVPVAVACVVATLCSVPGGIYPTQRRGPRYFTVGNVTRLLAGAQPAAMAVRGMVHAVNEAGNPAGVSFGGH